MEIDKIKDLVINAKLQQALQLLPDNNDTILIKSRFNRYQYDSTHTLKSTSELSIEYSKIISAILEIVDRYEPRPNSIVEVNKLHEFSVEELKNIFDSDLTVNTISKFKLAIEQILRFFKENLPLDEYRNFCSTAESTYEQFKLTPFHYKDIMLEQVVELFTEYRSFHIHEIASTDREVLLSKAKTTKTIQDVFSYIELYHTNLVEEFKTAVDILNSRYQTATPMAKRLAEIQMITHYLTIF